MIIPRQDVQYSPDGNHYVVDGEYYARMTHVLSKGNPKPFLDKWEKKVGKEEADRIRKYTAALGDKIHLITELWDKGQEKEALLLAETDPWLLNYLWSWVEYREKYITKIHAIELFVFSRRYRIGGRIDFLCEYLRDPTATLLDKKSSKSLDDHMGIQLFGYITMILEMIEDGLLPPEFAPNRAIIAHMPGPREAKDEKGNPIIGKLVFDFEEVKVKEYMWREYEEKFNETIRTYNAKYRDGQL